METLSIHYIHIQFVVNLQQGNIQQLSNHETQRRVSVLVVRLALIVPHARCYLPPKTQYRFGR
jgi:hypothetical protein